MIMITDTEGSVLDMVSKAFQNTESHQITSVLTIAFAAQLMMTVTTVANLRRSCLHHITNIALLQTITILWN